MARNGVWELQSVLLRYCASAGSSKGVREFIERDLVEFAKKNPQIQFSTKIKGGHPCVFAKYITGYERQRGLKNMSSEEVGKIFQTLRDTLGRKVPKHNQISGVALERKTESVQGIWRNPKSLVPELIPGMNKIVERRQGEYGLQVLLDNIGTSGMIRITQELLKKKDEMEQAILDAQPKKERVQATE